MIGLCTDSGAQLPPGLVDRFGIGVVALTVAIDGVDHREGVDLDADGFWSHFGGGRTPTVATAAPSPGRVLETYERLVAAGADTILSVHTGGELSGTVDAARLAAAQADVDVVVVDTGVASFMVGCAVLGAAEHLAAGGTVHGAAERARRVAGTCGNVFVVGGLELARRGGRLAEPAVVPGDAAGDGVPVLRLAGGQMVQVGEADDVDDAAMQMADEILRVGVPLRVGVAVADASSVPIADELRRRLASAPAELDLLDYRVGPSVGAHTGPGTAGAVYHPLHLGDPRR